MLNASAIPSLARLRDHIRRMGLAYLIFLVSLFPAVIVCARVRYNLQTRDQERLNQLVTEQRERIDRHFTSVTHILHGVRGLFLANEKIRGAEWNLFLDSLGFTEKATGFRDLGFALRVSDERLTNHVTEFRREIRPGYRVFPYGKRQEYFPITFLRDQDVGDVEALGWDPYANAVRRAAMDQARDSGFPICSDGVGMALPNGTNMSMIGHIVYLPVYRGAVQPASVEERRDKLVGFVFASFREEQLWQTILPRETEPLIDTEIFDGLKGALVYDAHPAIGAKGHRAAGTLATETNLRYYGHRFSMRASALPPFEQSNPHYVVWLVMLGCAGISLTLFSLARLQAKERAAAERIAANLRKEKLNEESLVHSQTRLRILNNILGLMAAGSEVTQIVVRTVGELSRNFPGYRIAFSVAERDGSWNPAACDGALGSVKGFPFRFDAAPELAAEIMEGRPLVVSDIDRDSRFKALAGVKYLEGVRAVLEQPIRHGPKFAGLLSFHSARPHEWTSAEMVILQEIAEYIAAAYSQEDIAERRRSAEAALQGEKERLAVTLRSIADGVITTDTAGKVILINRAAEAITGWTQADVSGRHISEVFSIVEEKTQRELPNPAERALAEGGVVEASGGVLLVARDGTRRTVAESAAAIRDQDSRVIGAAVVFRDITEKRRFESELLKASKLESVGLLAGGIAHDFNNILSIVLGNVSLCKMLVPPMGTVNERLAQAEKGCLRARELTQQLLTFAKGGSPIRKATSIIEIVHESTAFAVRGSNVVCKNQAAPNLWPVEVDEGQISQVFNNLVINAVQAMPEGGTLRTTMDNCAVVDGMGLPIPPGRYVHIAVTDTGTGIKREHLARIFDPYFSTKEGGSGLGLATTYAIIQKHQGFITVDSETNRGTTFHIYLPASSAPLPQKIVAPEAPPIGAGRVLVMDDEVSILDVARASLTHFGYEIDTAPDGAEAIRKFQIARATGKPFDLIVMDLTVPGGMGGKEAMKRLLEIDPAVRAIVSSGYSQDPVMANFREYGFCGVVEKPYQVEALAKTLGALLQRNGH